MPGGVPTYPTSAKGGQIFFLCSVLSYVRYLSWNVNDKSQSPSQLARDISILKIDCRISDRAKLLMFVQFQGGKIQNIVHATHKRPNKLPMRCCDRNWKNAAWKWQWLNFRLQGLFRKRSWYQNKCSVLSASLKPEKDTFEIWYTSAQH